MAYFQVKSKYTFCWLTFIFLRNRRRSWTEWETKHFSDFRDNWIILLPCIIYVDLGRHFTRYTYITFMHYCIFISSTLIDSCMCLLSYQFRQMHHRWSRSVSWIHLRCPTRERSRNSCHWSARIISIDQSHVDRQRTLTQWSMQGHIILQRAFMFLININYLTLPG